MTKLLTPPLTRRYDQTLRSISDVDKASYEGAGREGRSVKTAIGDPNLPKLSSRMLHIKQISPLGWAMYVDSTLFAAVIALLVCFFLKLDDDGGHPLSRASYQHCENISILLSSLIAMKIWRPSRLPLLPLPLQPKGSPLCSSNFPSTTAQINTT